MPFKKIDVREIVKNEREDSEFNQEYSKLKQEYKLIEKVADIRKQKKITQKELADATGVSQQAISRLEREKHIPQISTFIRILDGLDLELIIREK